jgi:hypothetical protein
VFSRNLLILMYILAAFMILSVFFLFLRNRFVSLSRWVIFFIFFWRFGVV